VSEKSGEIDHESEDISGSVSSIGSGIISPPRLAQELSRNAFVVSILFRERISLVRKHFWMHLKIQIFHDFSKFLQEWQEASRKFLGCFWSARELFRSPWDDFMKPRK